MDLLFKLAMLPFSVLGALMVLALAGAVVSLISSVILPKPKTQKAHPRSPR